MQSLQLTFVEIYNESVQDLLVAPAAFYGPRATPLHGQPSSISVPPLSLRETAKGEILIDGVTEMSVRSKEEVMVALEAGNTNRATAAHRCANHLGPHVEYQQVRDCGHCCDMHLADFCCRAACSRVQHR
jgi:hypothetical protein